MSLSAFTPNPNGPGGTISVYLNGQLVGTWNVTSNNGTLVPNGEYHFVLLEHTTDGNTVQMERDAFIPTFHGEPVAFWAFPAKAQQGESVTFTASFAGTVADGQSTIKVYAVSGELIRTLPISNGTASWDLRNLDGASLSAGLYLAVLDGVDPRNGQSFRKVVKILVNH